MGRNKGKQSGDFDRKCQNAHHRHTVYVDRASEANRYRNPMQIGSGQGYRNDAPCNNLDRSSGYWHRNGSSYGGGDKWSSIFSSSNRSSNNGISIQSSSNRSIAAATMGLSHLRHLLEDRQIEDRVHDSHRSYRRPGNRLETWSEASVT